MSLRLNKSTEAPPDGFRFTHQTGYVSRALDPYSWMEDIKRHYRDNHIPIPDNLQEIAEDQLCRTLPPGRCHFSDGSSPTDYIDVRVTLTDVLNGTKVFAAAVAQGFPLVEQSVAEERGAICAACPANVGIQGCRSCVGFAEKIAEVIGARKTRSDQFLEQRSCAWCKCSTKAQIWVPMDVLAKGITPEMMGRALPHCWKANGYKALTEAAQ